MKAKLLMFVLGAALVGGSTAALAGPGKGGGHDRPRAEQRQERYWGHDDRRKDRHYAGSRHQVRGDRHNPRWGKGHRHGPRWGKGHRHGRHWAKKHRHGHGWAKHRHYRHHAGRPGPHARYHGHGRHYRRHAPRNGVSIILHGHF